jgi:hypothetical protein
VKLNPTVVPCPRCSGFRLTCSLSDTEAWVLVAASERPIRAIVASAQILLTELPGRRGSIGERAGCLDRYIVGVTVEQAVEPRVSVCVGVSARPFGYCE